MEDGSLKKSVITLGRLLTQKEKIDRRISTLYREVGSLIGNPGTQPSPASERVTIPTTPRPRATRKTAASFPKVERGDGGAQQGVGREKQGAYMAAVRGLSLEEKLLVRQAKESQGIDYAITYAKGLKSGEYKAAGERPAEDESQAVPEVDGKLLDEV